MFKWLDNDVAEKVRLSRQIHRGIFSTALLSIGIGIALFCLFLVLKKHKKFYVPKCYDESVKNPPSRNESDGIKSWLKYTIQYKEELLMEEVGGYDMIAYLTFIKYCIIFFAVITILGIAVLFTNISGGIHTGREDATSIANIPAGSDKLYLHFLSVIFISLITFFFIHKMYSKTIRLNAKHIHLQLPKYHCILVRELMHKLKNDEALKRYFSRIYDKSNILDAYVIPDVQELRRLQKKRKRIARLLQRARDIYEESGNSQRPTHKSIAFLNNNLTPSSRIGNLFSLHKEQVDSIQYYERMISDLDVKITELQSQRHPPTHSGFVVFNSVTMALVASQVQHHMNRDKLKVYFAPDPNSIVWRCFSRKEEEMWSRRILVNGLLVILFLFWTIPVTFISAFMNLDTLSRIRGINFLLEWSFLRGILVGFLPTAAIVLFMAVLPWILTGIINLRCHVLRTQKHKEICLVYWLFLLLNVFLILTISGSIFGALAVIVHPVSIIQLLANTLPSQALFYINYIMIQTFIVRLDDLLIYKIKCWFFLKTKRERKRARQAPPFNFAYFYAMDLLIFTITLTYSTMAPLILFASLMYFGITWISAKHYFVWAQKPKYDGVNLSPFVIRAVIVALFIYELTMLGVFGLLNFAPGASLIMLLLVTVAYTWYIVRRYHNIEYTVAANDCPTQRSCYIPPDVYKSKLNYRDPALKPPPEVLGASSGKSPVDIILETGRADVRIRNEEHTESEIVEL